jgi:hypothetical protein
LSNTVPPADFREQVAQLRRELARLQQDLRSADASGDHRGALGILGRMLELQRTFFRRWSPPSANAAADGSQPGADAQGGSSYPGQSIDDRDPRSR